MSLIGGVVGGVVGLSFDGLSALPLSSVIPGPLPEPDAFASEPKALASMFVDAHEGTAGDEVFCDCLALIGALFMTLYAEAGRRSSIDGGL